jgi:16S rRNA G966 N2-methylase RsmD
MAKRKKAAAPGADLFIEESGQLRLTDKSAEQSSLESRTVECLGSTFPDDEARRAHFLRILEERLGDPKFRKRDDFPLGDDSDILALSDPPFYTACPNPFLRDFVTHYRGADQHESAPDPFVGDVTEGKTEHYYNVHTYHTKVPYRAIARFLLHYTVPGDVVLDAFCGTGMTGLAAQACASPRFVRELDPTCPKERVGERVTVLVDLSPAATHIATNYSAQTNPDLFERECNKILREFAAEYGWMFTTSDPKSGAECPVDYCVWSSVFGCPDCGHEIVFWDEGVDQDTGHKSSNTDLVCPSCKATNHRDKFVRVEETYFDDLLRTTAKRQKEKLILIAYRPKGKKKGLIKEPDAADLSILDRVNREPITDPIPLIKMMRRDGAWGDMYRAGYHLGITHFHHFYYRRSLRAVAWLWKRVEAAPTELRPRLRWWLQSVSIGHTRLNRYFSSSYSQVNRYLKGFLYIAQVRAEVAPWYALTGKVKRMAQSAPGRAPLAIATSSATSLDLDDSSVDYIFTDPPFGGNIIYSELNFMWEAWLRVFTNQGPEAIVSDTQEKDLGSYQVLMQRCFEEYFRVLKPGRWMTVLFHNSKNAVWIAIQSALEKAGFVVADVRVFDKKQLTMKQQTTTGAVQKDLLISSYRPNGGLEQQFRVHAGSSEGVWDFVRQHLKHLPVFIETAAGAEVIGERQPFLLFDRMVAFHVQRGVGVPIGAAEFYSGLKQKFPERDGMYFLPDQVAEYDRRRLQVKALAQLALFVTDERSAIQWLRQELERQSQTYQQIQPKFLKELHQADHEQLPELQELLHQNFLEDERHRWYVPDPNKQADLEKLREKALLQEFDEYKTSKRLKVFRTEAVRAGFKSAWAARDYQTILSVAAKLPEDVLQEDQTILMYFDNSSMRVGG